MQLKDAQRELDHGVGQIMHSLSAILGAATHVVDQGRSLYSGKGGGQGTGQGNGQGADSFLNRIKEMLA